MKTGWTGKRRSNGRHSFDSSGSTNGKNPLQIHEYYLNLARDANAAGDRIAEENYLQHAEHYLRVFSQMKETKNNNNNKGNRPKTYSFIPPKGSDS